MKDRLNTIPALLLVFLLLSGLANAQSGTTGAIEGRVLDEQGNPLPGAQVKISSPDLIGGAQSKMTTAEGKFRFGALPRGTYTLEGSLAGFTSVKRDDVRIFVGQTITVDLTLKIGTLEEEVTVVGASPLVDVKDSQMNATNLDLQMLQTVGGEMRFKNSTNLINLAPGVKDDSAMGAASRVSNQWNLDGQSLLTFIGSGADWQYPDLNIIEEAQVAGSGANAEYGGFTGAVLNLITKSGGNTLEGLAEFSYSPLRWNTTNFDPSNPKFSLFEAPNRILYMDAHLGLGGRIIRDKLWFYVSGGVIQQDEEYKGFSKRLSTQIPKGFGKLTWQINKNSRLSAFAEYEYFQVFNRGMSIDREADATYYDVGPGFPTSLSFLHTFSEDTFAEVKLGRYWSWYDQRPNKGRDVPERYDYLTGMYTGNMYFWGESDSTHYTASASLSHHAADFISGSHDFKVGVEFLTGNDNAATGYTGGFRYVDNYYGYSYTYYDYRYMTYAYSYGYNLKSNGWKASAFAQDSWKIGDRLTINPGIRWSRYRGFLPNLQSEAFFKPKDAIEARLGLTFDVFGDHTTALKAHYGRFHESFKTYFFNSLDPSIDDYVIYEVLQDGSKVETYRRSYAIAGTIDPNVRIPHSDQFTFGLERTLMKDTALSLTFIYREYKNFIARVNREATWDKYPWTFVDEDGNSQTIDIYRTGADSEDRFVVANPTEGASESEILTPKNKYTGLSIALNKRFSDGWMFHIDYTYSQTKGNHTNTTTASWGGTFYENPNRQLNASGYLPYDAPHALNIYGTVSLPFGFILTPRFTFQSGWNYTRTVTGPSAAGRPSIFIESRGSNRLPAQVSLDFRLEKLFSFTEKMKLGLMLDAFNVFNRGVETSLGGNVLLVNYGKAFSVCEPRYFRVGLRLYF
jgi:outer membrane receptor protein involved in Fe transport